jgi:hypothetical protein
MSSSDFKICVSFVGERPYTTGVHIFNACKKLYPDTVVAPPHALPLGCDLYFHVDSGHENTRILSPKDKTIFYAIDDYQNHPKFSWNSRLAWWEHVIENTFMFVDAFEYGTEWLKTKHDKVHYISMGYDPDLYYYEEMEKKYDVCFVGSHYGKREHLLGLVSKHFSLYAPTWDEAPTFSDSLRHAACSAKCYLDIPPIDDNMLGQRFFEGYACKVPMVSQDRPCIKPYVKNGITLYNLENLEESLVEAINEAMKIEAPVERCLTGDSLEAKMDWVEKVDFAINTYKKYKGL